MESSTPPNQIPSEHFLKRYKILWRAFLISNLALGAYIFANAGKKEKGEEKKEESPAKIAPAPAPATVHVPALEEPVFSPPVTMPVIVRPPVSEDQQREIFKWILEEKRKVKPQNREEKKRINEEKAILKEFIRAESVPKI